MFNPTSPCDRIQRHGSDFRRKFLPRAVAVGLAAFAPLTALPTPTDISSIPLPTYTVGSTFDVKPNILFVLDDSGSMDWDFLPDWANPFTGNTSGYRVNYTSVPPYQAYNAAFNGVAYNPAVTYSPPVIFTSAGAKDTTSYPSMTGTSTSTGGDSLATSSSPNWNKVKYDAYGVQSADGNNSMTAQSTSSGKTTLTDNAFYYTVLPGEYCTTPGMTSCATTPTATATYQYPASLRWCDSAALTNCKALPDSSFMYPRMPAPRISTLTVPSPSTNRVINGITVGGMQIMSAATAASSSAPTIASRIADAINACATVQTGNCTIVGYTAYSASSSVTIYAPGVTSSTPVASTDNPTYTNSVNSAFSAFGPAPIPLSPWLRGTSQSSTTIPGENVRTVITSSINSYSYPGTSAKASSRTDCAGSTCTFKEEMTNYANWWTYYHTRMQMMKTAGSLAFSTLDSDSDIAKGKTRYRVGYFSLNNNTGTDMVNLADFDASGKFAWYSQFLKAKPNNGTVLRSALSDAGRLYGGKLNGSNYNGVTVTDPLQYSCQRNYTILSTDGFWNGKAGYKLDGSTAAGNQDGSLPRPYNDGYNVQAQQKTNQLQARTDQLFAEKGTLQKQTSQLQKSTSDLQTQTSQLQALTTQVLQATSSNSGASYGSFTPVSSCTWKTGGTNRTKCQYDSTATWAGVASCAQHAKDTSTSNNSVWIPAVSNCQTVVTSAFQNTGTCTTVTTPDANGYTTQCQYSTFSTPVGVASCTTKNKDTTSPYNVAQAVACNTVVTSAYADSPSCSFTTTPDINGYTTQCAYSWATAAATTTSSPTFVANDYTNVTVYRNPTRQSGASWTNVSSCTSTSTPDASGHYTSCQYAGWTSNWSNVASCTPANPSSGPNYTVGVATQCQTVTTTGNNDTLADVAAYYYNTDLRSATQTGADKTGPCSSSAGDDLCTNNVIPYSRDTATWQHMTVHTLGLGAQGEMVFSPYQNNSAGQRVRVPDYWSQPSGDFYAVANGSTADSSICSWMSPGSTCTWPTPASDSIANIDDLWHAAVNGHGTYFSATDPSSLASGLSAVLSQIINTPRPGTAAAAASSNPNITSSDNYVFSSSYQSINWFGELIMQRFNDDGTLGDEQWSAMQQLDCDTTAWNPATSYAVGQVYNQGGRCYLVKTAYTSGTGFDGTSSGVDGANATVLTGAAVTRKIYMAKAGSLAPFTWGSLTSAQQAYFSTPNLTYVSASQGLSQFCSAGSSCLDTTAQAAASGAALVNYLAGDRTNEGGYFRARLHILGDIVSSEARYVKQPLQGYLDTNYSAYVAAQASRSPTVYVGANDGMLHAFNALTGEERWAYIPTAVMPNLYRLADLNYPNQHQYFVDGTPEVGDICPGAPSTTCTASQWRTVLVGGLNQGGRSFYALDITDPDNPSLLWEFSNANLGYAYSNPRITKLADGTWVVILASGYNNTDGIGRLFVLNAATGTLINTISTGVGTAGNPSGLAKIAARSSTGSTNNTVDEVYGGDLLGNVWRFDVNGNVGASGTDAQLVINLQDPTNNPQPITSKPVVASVNGTPLIMVGTGEYLGKTDLQSPNTGNTYSMYAIKYPQTATTTLTTPRSNTKFVQQTLTRTTCPAGTSSTICDQGQSVLTASNNAVDWAVNDGWYFDFANGGERSVTDATLALGTLTFTTIKPQTSTTGTITACTGSDTSVNAQSFLYYVNYLTGGPVAGTQGVVGELLCTCVATRPSVVKTQGGTVEGIIRLSGGGVSQGTDMGVTNRQDLPYTPSGGPTRRTSWRLLNGD